MFSLVGIDSYSKALFVVSVTYFSGSLGSMSSRGSLYNDDAPIASDVVTW